MLQNVRLGLSSMYRYLRVVEVSLHVDQDDSRKGTRDHHKETFIFILGAEKV